jgi:hypothetical protein
MKAQAEQDGERGEDSETRRRPAQESPRALIAAVLDCSAPGATEAAFLANKPSLVGSRFWLVLQQRTEARQLNPHFIEEA